MQILIRAPKELKEILQARAKKIGVTLNALIILVLWDWIEMTETESQNKE